MEMQNAIQMICDIINARDQFTQDEKTQKFLLYCDTCINTSFNNTVDITNNSPIRDIIDHHTNWNTQVDIIVNEIHKQIDTLCIADSTTIMLLGIPLKQM